MSPSLNWQAMSEKHKAVWTVARRKAASKRSLKHHAAKREWETRPQFSKIKKHEVQVREDGLLYRRGKPIKCRRNDEVRRMRAEGKTDEEIRKFLEYFDVKGLE